MTAPARTTEEIADAGAAAVAGWDPMDQDAMDLAAAIIGAAQTQGDAA